MQKGFALLFSVIIIGSILGTFALTQSHLNAKDVVRAREYLHVDRSRVAAEGCAELALQLVRDREGSGNGTHVYTADVSCEYSFSESNDEFSISINGSDGVYEYDATIEGIIDNGFVEIESWESS